MPSSLIWVALVAGWVLVLFPMLSGSRMPVRRTSAAAEEARVLHRGGKARPTRRGPAVGHLSDPEWQPSPEDEQARRARPSSTDPKTAPVEAQMDSAATDSESGGDAKVTFTPAAPRVLDAVVVGEELEDELDTSDAETTQDAELVEVPEAAEKPETPESAETPETTVTPEATVTLEAPETLEDEPMEDGSVAAEHVAEQGDVVDTVDENGERTVMARVPSEPRPQRAGRGGFDPVGDAAAPAIRYRNRQRTVLGLAGATVVCILAALLASTLFVWGAVVFGGLFVAYMSYLRRTVRMEAQIRARRLARMKQSRRAAVAERRAADTVPSEARRYGAVVLELDDEDPAFEHLPHYQSVVRSQETRVAG